MGLFSGLLGHASDVDLAKVHEELQPILADGEELELGFQVVRDQMIFSDRRIILIDKQGMTGRKREYLSIPYKSITMFSVENSGSFDMESEMKVWVSGQAAPIAKTLDRKSNIAGIQSALAKGVCR
ncbi:PH domain-containing protein [Pararhizobium haloflavum]|uniref:PH domain-containing protein n=1 Tax=Pararhizobium haloflavum TaxID=2037914 RepID=UPI000C196B8A|nr:PH domain-containing protein [Pararhizobium haloflavum]